MAAAGTPFSGVLYAGLMLTADGPKLIEYNVRFGDPECEAIMPLIDGDFAELLHAVATGRLARSMPPHSAGEARDDGDRRRARLSRHAGQRRAIRAIEAAEQVEGVTVFHAGTALGDGGARRQGRPGACRHRASPTRFANARARAYRAVDQIDFADGFHRRDIGWRELARTTA